MSGGKKEFCSVCSLLATIKSSGAAFAALRQTIRFLGTAEKGVFGGSSDDN